MFLAVFMSSPDKNRYRFCFFWFKPKENSPSAASRGKHKSGPVAALQKNPEDIYQQGFKNINYWGLN